MSKRENREIYDDGRTVANMNVAGLPWYKSQKTITRERHIQNLGLMPKERRAIIMGAYKAYLPVFLGILGGFVVAYLLFYIWAITV